MNMEQPVNTETTQSTKWAARWQALRDWLGAAWLRGEVWLERVSRDYSVTTFVVVLLFAVGLWAALSILPQRPRAIPPVAPQAPDLQSQIDQLNLRVILLQVQIEALPPAAAPTRRNNYSLQGRTPKTETHVEQQPAPAPRWRITDLDRELAEFNRSLQEHQP